MIEDFYNSTALVEQATRPAATRRVGGAATTFSTRIASLPCRISKAIASSTISESDYKGKMTSRTTIRLYCSASTANKAIKESDRVTVDGRNYQITGIYNPGNLDRHLEIDLLEIR